MCTSTVACALREARRLLTDNDCPAAIEKLNQALADSPDDGRLWDLLGVALWDSGAVQDSIEALEHATILVPLSPEGQLALGLGYEVVQKRELALELLLGLAGRDHLSPAILEQLARALGRAGEFSTALHVCQRAASAMPESPAPLLGVAYYMTRLGASSEQLLPALFRAMHLDPHDTGVRILLARRLHDCGMSEDAAEVLRLVDLSKYRCVRCLAAMQEIFQAAGDFESADECQAALHSMH